MFTSWNARAAGLSLSARESVDLASSSGFGGVDLMVRDLVDSGDDPKAVRARMDAAGLRGGAFPLPVGWRGGEDAFARDLERLPRYAEAAAALGLLRTATWVLPETSGRPDDPGAKAADRAETVEFHARRLGAVARVLGAYGIRLGLEVIGPASARTGRGWPFVTRRGDLSATLGPLLEAWPNVGVLADAFHLGAAGEPVEAAFDLGVERVVWVHVADLPTAARKDRALARDDDRALPGEGGATGSRQLLKGLAERGYDGPVTAEPMAGCRSLAGLSAFETARLVARALQSVWPP